MRIARQPTLSATTVWRTCRCVTPDSDSCQRLSRNNDITDSKQRRYETALMTEAPTARYKPYPQSIVITPRPKSRSAWSFDTHMGLPFTRTIYRQLSTPLDGHVCNALDLGSHRFAPQATSLARHGMIDEETILRTKPRMSAAHR